MPEDARETISDYLIIPPESECLIERSFAKIRPYFEDFPKIILPIYDIFVYTKGTRMYAEEICRALRKKYEHILGSSKNFTRSWLISRDEDPNMKKSLNFVLPNLRDFILILDDRRDVTLLSLRCGTTLPSASSLNPTTTFFSSPTSRGRSSSKLPSGRKEGAASRRMLTWKLSTQSPSTKKLPNSRLPKTLSTLQQPKSTLLKRKALQY